MDWSYYGSGKTYVRRVADAADQGFRFLGNCSALDFNITEDVKEQLDYTKQGGGTYNEVRRITAVEAAITMAELSPENLALALLGNTAESAAGSITDEPVTAHLDQLCPIASPPGSGYVVTDVGAVTTYVEGVDYQVQNSGIIPLSTGTITDLEPLLVSYDNAAAQVVQALTEAAQEYEIIFDGLNEARSGKSTVINAFRVKLGAAQVIAWLADDYANIPVTGKLLQDASKTGANESQYFTATMQE